MGGAERLNDALVRVCLYVYVCTALFYAYKLCKNVSVSRQIRLDSIVISENVGSMYYYDNNYLHIRINIMKVCCARAFAMLN